MLSFFFTLTSLSIAAVGVAIKPTDVIQSAALIPEISPEIKSDVISLRAGRVAVAGSASKKSSLRIRGKVRSQLVRGILGLPTPTPTPLSQPHPLF